MTARQRQRVFNAWFTNTLGSTQASAIAEETAWQDEGLCAEIGGDAWFPEKGDPTGPAKKICRLCPVVQDCLRYAVDNGIWHGVWGGTSAQERRPMIHAHREALEEVAA